MEGSRIRARLRGVIGAIMMGAGFIGLPSIPDDLSRWGPIVGAILGLVGWVFGIVSPDNLLGRWIVFALGAYIFWRSMHASIAVPVPTATPRQDTLADRVLDRPDDAAERTDATSRLNEAERRLEIADHEPIVHESEKDGRAYVQSSPAFLTSDLFADRLAIQAKALTEQYIGKWMRTSGKVWDVYDFTKEWEDEDDQVVTVSLGEKHFERPDISLWFSRTKWKERLSALRRGDEIAVSGQIASLELGKLLLQNCELEEVLPHKREKDAR